MTWGWQAPPIPANTVTACSLFSSLSHKPGVMVEMAGWVAPHGTEISGDKVTVSFSALPGGLQTSVPRTQPLPCPEPLDKNQDGVQGRGVSGGLGSGQKDPPTLTGVMSVVTYREPR